MARPASRSSGSTHAELSRFARHYDENDYVKAGARVITYDRPSYGGSDRHRAGASSKGVGDVAATADTLGSNASR
jgi:hypothetical protein